MLSPPVEPMLAKLARELPLDGHAYEPKWDGFRCLAFRDGDAVDLRSRNQRPFARYFPEVVEALLAVPEERFALDGELIVCGPDGSIDFTALLGRLHPAASRVERLRRETPASFVGFDALVPGGYRARRAELERLLGDRPPPLFVTPTTDDPACAQEWLDRFCGGGLDGVVAKPLDAPYAPGKRAMVKVKHERTADCVVAGFRWHGSQDVVGSLLLGLLDDAGALLHVGVVTAFTKVRRAELVDELRPLVAPIEGHPWEHGFLLAGGSLGRLKGAAGRWEPGMTMDWVPLRPELVVEVAFDQVDLDVRLRHPARFRRWRPDRDPSSCHVEQLATPAVDVGQIVRR